MDTHLTLVRSMISPLDELDLQGPRVRARRVQDGEAFVIRVQLVARWQDVPVTTADPGDLILQTENICQSPICQCHRVVRDIYSANIKQGIQLQLVVCLELKNMRTMEHEFMQLLNTKQTQTTPTLSTPATLHMRNATPPSCTVVLCAIICNGKKKKTKR
jgi:hypothetical protein